jgi:hypothetical protein
VCYDSTVQKRGNQRRARLWPWLLIVPAAIALIDIGRRESPAPDTARETQSATPERRAPAQPAGPSRRARAPARAPHEAAAQELPGETAEPLAAAQRIDPCRGVSAYGTCAGQVATACIAGQVMTVDCAEHGERCVMTREGASCLPRRGAHVDCLPADAPSCQGDVLRHCVDGTWQNVDCAMRLARCDAPAGRAQCVSTPAAALASGADSRAGGAVETCDGKDQDDDDVVDEQGVCDEIALVAFVPIGAELRDLEARMQDELAIVNRVFHPMTFAWRRTVHTAQARPSFHPNMFRELAATLSNAEPAKIEHPRTPPAAAATPADAAPATAFYIPVLYVESIQTSPPKAGMSTLPNSRCGGVRVSDHPAPPEGLIVVSEVRQPETLAHELGHYLGLCHTHEELGAYGAAADAACNGSGDGICDTAFDPGPPHCAELYTCAAHCEGIAAAPDTSNVMSYYMMCRRGLSPQQLTEVERNLNLRRGWFACLDPGACPCTPGDPAACPAEMSCQPAQRLDAVAECVLDGPALPGAPCSHLGDCSGGSICIGASSDDVAPRCVRACSADDDACTCTDVGLPYRVCRQDLT